MGHWVSRYHGIGCNTPSLGYSELQRCLCDTTGEEGKMDAMPPLQFDLDMVLRDPGGGGRYLRIGGNTHASAAKFSALVSSCK